MIHSFKNDYSEGAHPKILEALQQTNTEQHDGYAEDTWCLKAAGVIRELIQQPLADVHFVSGGTQANAIVINAMLKPYEAVISADTGHINVHEAGAIESRGHKVLTVPSPDGKLSCDGIVSLLDAHTNEHMVKPKMVYLSNATETGTVYTKGELQAISRFCRSKDLYVYLDGARIGCALMADSNDLTLPMISELTDVFYIGGTKNGALMGEAIVINHDGFKDNFRYHLKQNGALLSKSRIMGLQFYTLFGNELYFKLACHANEMAARLSNKISTLGYAFFSRSETNQIFPILSNDTIQRLSELFAFYVWEKIDEKNSAIRLVTSWATPKSAVDQFITRLEELS